jgi:hypothetical protein
MTNITLKRITRARRAMMAAQNPQFRNYWKGVADQLIKGLDD